MRKFPFGREKEKKKPKAELELLVSWLFIFEVVAYKAGMKM